MNTYLFLTDCKKITQAFSIFNKKLLLLLLLSGVHFYSHTQWNTINTGINDKLTGIVFWGSNGVVSGNKGIYFTNTGGLNPGSWSRFNISGNTNDSIIYNNTKFNHCFANNLITENNKVFACGQDTVNNVAVVMKFNLPLMTYSLVYTGLPNSALNNIAYSQFDNKYYAVGDHGLVLNFNPNGNGASILTNNMAQNFNSISFSSYDNRFTIATNGYQVFGTNNTSVLQFTEIPLAGLNSKDTYCKTTSTYTYTGVSFIETNYGNITHYGINDFDSLNGQCIAYKNSTVFLGTDHGIFKQVNSNCKFEWQPTSGAHSILEFWYEADNATVFYACGNNGIILKTFSNGGASKPFATMSNLGTCTGGINIWVTSDPGSGTSCSWKVDGNPANGNCSYLAYPTDTASSYAITYITTNGTYSDTAFGTWNILDPPQFNLPYSVTDTILCKSEPLEITIENTEENVYYSLYKYGSSLSLGNSEISMGGTLTFQTNNITSSGNYYLRASNATANCFRDFTDTIKIIVEKTKANLHTGLINAEVNENTPFYEQCTDAQNFLWTFINQGNTLNSSLPNPFIQFPNTGNTDVKLVCFSDAGCYDSIVKNGPNIINTNSVEDSCWTSQNRGVDLSWQGHYTPDIGKMLLTKDGYYAVGQYSDVSFDSRYGNSLSEPNAGAYINKYDRNGTLKWSIHSSYPLVNMNLESNRDCFYEIKEDSQRNIIVVGKTNLIIDNTGDTILFSYYSQRFILKIDTLGKIIWKLSSVFFAPQFIGIDHDDNIIFNCLRTQSSPNTTTSLVNYLSGTTSDTISFNNVFTNQGLVKISTNGHLIWGVSLEISGPNSKEILNIGLDSLNNIYFSGNGENSFTFYDANNPTPTSFVPYGELYSANPFIVKYSSDGIRQWTSYAYGKVDGSYSVYMLKATTTEDGTTYFTGRNVWPSGSFSLVYKNPDNSIVKDPGASYFVMKIDKNGYCQWINSMIPTGIESGQGSEIMVKNQQVHVLTWFLGNIPANFTFTGEIGEQITVPGSEENFCVNIYDTSGVLQKTIVNNITTSNRSGLESFNGFFMDTAGYYYTSRNIKNLETVPYEEFSYTLTPTIQYDCDGWVTRFHEDCGYVYYPAFQIATTVDVCSGTNVILPNGVSLPDLDNDTTVTFSHTSTYGMDSITSYHVQITPIETYLSDTICYGESYTFSDGFTVNSITSLTSHSTLYTTAEGCDSIVNTSVSPNTFDTNINNDNGTLQSNETNVSYQWLDCDNNFVPIPGEITSQFTPAANGSYALKLSNTTCSDTSVCITINTVSLSDFITQKEDVLLYPNPFREMITIHFESTQNNFQLKLFDISGKELLRQNHFSTNKIELNITSKPGIYFLEITDENAVIKCIKVIKQ